MVAFRRSSRQIAIGVLITLYWTLESTEARLETKLSQILDQCWVKFKSALNKTYPNTLERLRRHAWEDNILLIYNHNMQYEAGHHGYLLRDHWLADLTPAEYLRKFVTLKPSIFPRLTKEVQENWDRNAVDPKSVPARLDWREKGFITKSENQRDCGSCYAYSVAGCVAGQIFKKTGKVVDLSEQQMVDCSVITGNLGCNGGSLERTLRYLVRSDGLALEENYPYKASQGACKYNRKMSVANITSWGILPAKNETALKVAVATIGPIAVSVDASPRTFQMYHTGIYDDLRCKSDRVNHAMLLVGYTETYWILKNWWGSTWGENGYMRLAKGRNSCGIANYAAYAKV